MTKYFIETYTNSCLVPKLRMYSLSCNDKIQHTFAAKSPTPALNPSRPCVIAYLMFLVNSLKLKASHSPLFEMIADYRYMYKALKILSDAFSMILTNKKYL